MGRNRNMDIKLFRERIRPYFWAAVVTAFFVIKKWCFIDNKNMNDALSGVITVCSIIIGFLGAILPVILGMRNDSKVARYIFELDEDKLFLKYTKVTLLYGLILIMISVLLYFREDLSHGKAFFYAWVFMIVLFLVATYRSVGNMMTLIFMGDKQITRKRIKSSKEQREEELGKQMDHDRSEFESSEFR